MNPSQPLRERITILVLTYNRIGELRRTLTRMLAMEDGPEVLVVDNASSDSTAAQVALDFPRATLIRLEENIGAAARNIGLRRARTPYVAFCDDDTWWEIPALTQAAEMLDEHPRIAVLNARVLVGPQQREDPTCAQMEKSPLPSTGLPGKALLGFLAGACVVRKEAFIEAGGYEPKFFIGGEEALLALDMIANGWTLVYCPQLIAHHYPSSQRDSSSRRRLLIRNAFWVAWMRLPFFTALRQTLRICRSSAAAPFLLFDALREMRWILRRRKVLPPRALAMYYLLERT